MGNGDVPWIGQYGVHGLPQQQADWNVGSGTLSYNGFKVDWEEKKRQSHRSALAHCYLTQANNQSRGWPDGLPPSLTPPPFFSPSDLTFLPCAHAFNWVWDLPWYWPPCTQVLKFLECIFCLSTRGYISYVGLWNGLNNRIPSSGASTCWS